MEIQGRIDQVLLGDLPHSRDVYRVLGEHGIRPTKSPRGDGMVKFAAILRGGRQTEPDAIYSLSRHLRSVMRSPPTVSATELRLEVDTGSERRTDRLLRKLAKEIYLQRVQDVGCWYPEYGNTFYVGTRDSERRVTLYADRKPKPPRWTNRRVLAVQLRLKRNPLRREGIRRLIDLPVDTYWITQILARHLQFGAHDWARMFEVFEPHGEKPKRFYKTVDDVIDIVGGDNAQLARFVAGHIARSHECEPGYRHWLEPSERWESLTC